MKNQKTKSHNKKLQEQKKKKGIMHEKKIKTEVVQLMQHELRSQRNRKGNDKSSYWWMRQN